MESVNTETPLDLWCALRYLSHDDYCNIMTSLETRSSDDLVSRNIVSGVVRGAYNKMSHLSTYRGDFEALDLYHDLVCAYRLNQMLSCYMRPTSSGKKGTCCKAYDLYVRWESI